MADIRINALATTATTPASDDYLALDGAAQGTRKILATNIANNVTDVILGASGPSVKSTLSARAPRQGLVFDGTAGASGTLASAIGTSDFTINAVFQVPSAANFNGPGIAGIGNVGTANAFSVYVYGNDLYVSLWGATGSDFRSAVVANVVTNLAGKTAKVTAVRNATTPSLTIYLNGISVSYTESTGGTAPTWAGSVSSTTFYVGKLTTSGNYYTGLVAGPDIYNRALSASEVVALYEAGAPSAGDYNSASNTSIASSTWVNTSYTSFSGASATGFTAVKASGTGYAESRPNLAINKGQKFRFTGTLTLNNGKTVLPYVLIQTDSTAVQIPASGSFDVTVTADSTVAGGAVAYFRSSGDADYTVSNVSVTRLGLLLAPDAAQAGNGYVWNDQSGNLAQIVLPSSGVAWNLPSVAGNRIRGTTSTNGNQQLLGASTLLPAECQITHVRARARSGTPTITIGTASGGAQIVASVALSTTWLNCTIALTGGIVSSADDIWVGSNSTDVVETDIAFQPLDF